MGSRILVRIRSRKITRKSSKEVNFLDRYGKALIASQKNGVKALFGGDENVSVTHNRLDGKRNIDFNFTNRRRSISIGRNDSENSRASRLSRTSIGIKDQLDQKKSIFLKRGDSSKLSGDNLDRLYNQCLNLLKQNKISSKNAFEILLIDHLDDIVNVENPKDEPSEERKKVDHDLEGEARASKLGSNLGTRNPGEPSSESNFEKFQRAAVTLEASARIYGYRVDSTFDNAYRVLSNIKSGRVLANDDSGSDSSSESEDDGKEKESSELDEGTEVGEKENCKKKARKKVTFSDDNYTVVDNPELISIKEFEKSKEIGEKPFFVKHLNDELKLAKIKFGVDCGNIGSISSLLMTNLELKNRYNESENSVSLSFNISGKDKLADRRLKSLKVSQAFQNNLLKVNKQTLDLLLPNSRGNDDGPISNELGRILDSIREIANKNSDNELVKSSVCFDFDDTLRDFKSVNEKGCSWKDEFPNFEEGFGGHDMLENELEIDKDLSCDSPNMFGIKEQVKKFFETSDNNLSLKVEKGNSQDSVDSKLGDIIDFLAKNSARSRATKASSGKKTQSKAKSSKSEAKFEPIAPLITNQVFNGLEWIKSLPKNKISRNAMGRTRPKAQINKIFVGKNYTYSIFNYNLNHLFCLANLTGVKINLELIHNIKRAKETSSLGGDLLVNMERDHLGDSFPYDSRSEEIDLMDRHCEMEKMMHSDDNYFPEGRLDFKSNRDMLILPLDQVDLKATDRLMEKSSRSLLVRDEYSASLKFSKSSTNVDIDKVKHVLRRSIQKLYTDNLALTLSNIIKHSVS
ncbi:Condensin complex subunit 2 [Cryptosporidium felis]|nr:Condensin complex subunit 2 [Cryptosporidium felis]